MKAMGKHRIAVGLMIGISICTGAAAFAQDRHEDVFIRTTGSPPPLRATVSRTATHAVPAIPVPVLPLPVYNYGAEPAQKWFAAMDAQVVTHLATSPEKMILSRSFGSPPQLERVIEWTNTAGGVARKFRQLAKTLKIMPLPSALSSDSSSNGVNFYREALADWYDDQAAVLEDYIRPRPAARTQEELKGQLEQMHQRVESNKLAFSHLTEMDSHLRKQYNVRSALYGDMLMQYAMSAKDKKRDQ